MIFGFGCMTLQDFLIVKQFRLYSLHKLFEDFNTAVI